MPSFDMDKLKNISILDYATKKGYEITKIKDDYYKIPNLGGTYITPSKNAFYSFGNKSGGGIFQFVSFMEGVSIKEATYRLNDEYINGNVTVNISRPSNTQAKNNIEKEKVFVLPNKNKDNAEIINYLSNYRKIDEEFINKAIAENMIFQKQKDRNLVLLVKNSKDEIVGAEWINTAQSGEYKGKKAFVAGSKIGEDCGFVFKGTGDKLYLFESPIDMMSYLTIHKLNNNYDKIKNETFLSNWSIANDKIVLNYLDNNKNIKEVYICYDNDIDGTKMVNGEKVSFNYGQEAGKELALKLEENGYISKIFTPKEKDYNDVLKSIVKNKDNNIEKKNILDDERSNLNTSNIKENNNKVDNDMSPTPSDIIVSADKNTNIIKETYVKSKELKEKEEKLKDDISNLEKQLAQVEEEIQEKLKLKENIVTKMIKVNKEHIRTLYEIKEEENLLNFKNSARLMLESGIEIGMVSQVTKLDMEMLKEIQKELIENKINTYGYNPDITEANLYINNTKDFSELSSFEKDDYIPVLERD